MTAGGNEIREGREYPRAPVAGVAAVVVCGEEVLLIRRGREPLLGAWSLPGGALELGETTAEGVVREVFEETGIHVQPIEVAATLDRILRDDAGRVQFHYILVEWLCFCESPNELVCGDDAAEARWVRRAELFSETYALDATTLGVIESALKIAETIKR
ncbi:MAG: NUDIX hydrolase [Acidobacteria bacterium]|nr:NUDIX hydrolase [Acidobacteriota bacterium]